MGETVEKKKLETAVMMPMTPDMLLGIHRVFAQKISFEITDESASLTFGSVANIKQTDTTEPQEVMIPQVICHMTIPHLFRLRDMLAKQCDLFEQAMNEQTTEEQKGGK